MMFVSDSLLKPKAAVRDSTDMMVLEDISEHGNGQGADGAVQPHPTGNKK